MASNRQFLLFSLVSFCTVYYAASSTPFEWMKRDSWDIVNDMFSNVTAQNCKSKSKEQLLLPENTVTGIPKYNELLSSRIYSNRSALLHAHNMALNRAFFYSLIYQRLNQTWDFDSQPGLMYIYLSSAADVSASPGWINGTGLYFNFNCSYPNWYSTLGYNTTILYFAPQSWREDDYNEPTNFLREPTNSTIDVVDLGTGNNRNYLDPRFKGNPTLRWWLPDLDKTLDSTRKFVYSVGTMYSNKTGTFVKDTFHEFNFFGPPQPKSDASKDKLPVIISRPYFDCGRTNRWLVSASSPVTEFMPRHVEWLHIRRARFTAVSTVDLEFERLDMNQCNLSEGNIGPNIFAGTHRCRDTTMCEPLSGYGFRRGGYQCVCNLGYYYPWWHDGPFLGRELEQATKDEYEVGFDCLTVQDRRVRAMVVPKLVRAKRSVSVVDKYEKFLNDIGASQQSTRMTRRQKRTLMSRLTDLNQEIKREKREAEEAPAKLQRKKRLVAKKPLMAPLTSAHKRSKREAVDEEAVSRMSKIMQRFRTTNKNNCDKKKAYELFLPGDAGFGADKQFEAQGRTALRLAHFLSAFLQNVDEYEEYGDLKGDRRLNETQLFAEVIANVMADWKILGSGVFFDRYKFRMSPPVNNTDPRFINGITREFFGPYSWRVLQTQGTGSIGGADNTNAMDMAGLKTYYTDEQWFRNMKARWATNFVALKKHSVKPMIRSNKEGNSSIRFIFYPLTYRAVRYEDGEWLRPQYKCDGRVNQWVVTYLAPFFGKDDIKQDIEFKGVVSVDVDLNELVIEQCPAPFHVANAFKNTARCFYESQRCEPSKGYGHTSAYFTPGLYKCECRQGFEYPRNDGSWFIDGSTMEKEYALFSNPSTRSKSRYESLQCRKAGASSLTSNYTVFALISLISILLVARI